MVKKKLNQDSRVKIRFNKYSYNLAPILFSSLLAEKLLIWRKMVPPSLFIIRRVVGGSLYLERRLLNNLTRNYLQIICFSLSQARVASGARKNVVFFNIKDPWSHEC